MYTVYKVTNNINNKTYIGVHKTDIINDSYMGSGIAIKNAILKYGKENFTKEILLVTEDKHQAYSFEKELTLNFNEGNNYNMKLGGVGGFTPENARKGLIARSRKGGIVSKEKKVGYHSFTKEQLAENGRKGGLKLKGIPKSEAHKEAIRQAWLRKKNMPL